MRRSKKTSKSRVTGLCAGNSPGTGEFPAQMASNAENVSIWWRHHVAKFQTHFGDTSVISDILFLCCIIRKQLFIDNRTMIWYDSNRPIQYNSDDASISI